MAQIYKNFDDGMLYVIPQKGGRFPICNLFEVDRIIIPINMNDDVDIKYLIKVYDKYHYNQNFYLTVSQLNDSKLLKNLFFNHMIIFSGKCLDTIIEYIKSEIEECQSKDKVIYQTGIIGWQDIPGLKDKLFVLSQNSNSPYPIEYFDNTLKFKNGTLEGQNQFIIDNIIPFKETRLAMVLGLSSVIASYIERYKSIGTLVVNVSGKSSTGKSSIVELSASFFATPETSNYGIVRTFNATKNFIFSMSEGRNGLPIILDDANANSSEHSKADLIYQFAMGEPRGRCGNLGVVQSKRVGWSGIVILTSEMPLLDSERVSRGANARCITLDSIPWTQSAEHSDVIKEGVRSNYGYIGEEFANFIQRKGAVNLLDLHSKYTKAIISKMIYKDSLSNRIASKLAIIALTAHLIPEFNNDFTIDVEEIMDMMIEAEQKSVDTRDIATISFELLIDYITQKQSHFCVYQRVKEHQNLLELTSIARGDTFGMYLYDEGSYVYILKSIFDKFLKDNHISENRTILQEWKTRRTNNRTRRRS